MNKTYLEISITANEHQQELLIPTMTELGCQGFQETETHLLCYIEKTHWNDAKSSALTLELIRLRRMQTISANSDVQFRDIEEENWNAAWEKTIRPIEVGEKLVIKPSWQEYNNAANRIVIQIDPKMSFGTGYHETTRLTLQLLEKYVDAGRRLPTGRIVDDSSRFSMLDVGTGTGILAIAAVKLGAKSAIGIDNDEWAIENACENVNANGLADKITISSESLDTLHSTFDLIAANLQFNTIIEMLEIFRTKLRNDGLLLLSGLLVEDKENILRQLHEQWFTVVESLQENEWIALAAKKIS